MQPSFISSLLDALLKTAADKYLGSHIPCSTLLSQSGFTGEKKLGLFLINILIADGYLLKHDISHSHSSEPIVTISPQGFRFIYTGGYQQHIPENIEQIKQEQEKLKWELKSLKQHRWVSIVSLVFAATALVISIWI